MSASDERHCLSNVMPGLVPGIYDFLVAKKTWMAGDISAFTRVHSPSKTGIGALMDALCPAMTTL
jgi:hypothetical protein